MIAYDSEMKLRIEESVEKEIFSMIGIRFSAQYGWL